MTKVSLLIKDRITLSTGEIMAGHFAALNNVVKENRRWYFTGTYLYDFVGDVEQSKQLFDKTYENMTTFLEREDLDEIYRSLSKYHP